MDEIAFLSKETANAFAQAALANSKVYVADADRYAMQYLADILRLALDRNVLTDADLYTTEPSVITKLTDSSVTMPLWAHFRGFSEMFRRDENPGLPSWLSVDAKKRYIDPLISGHGRVTGVSARMKAQIDEFLDGSFDYWITAT